MTLSLCACGAQTTAPAAEPAAAEPAAAMPVEAEPAAAPGSNVVILYTNDIHCGVNDNLTATGIAVAKQTLMAAGKQVLLVDCGDAVQGDSIGILSDGEYIIDIMNELGYDAAIPGNHEFTYSVEQFFKLTERADFPYLCANFFRADGTGLLAPYTILQADGAKIAFVGAVTPKTPATSTSSLFMDENGNALYDFCQDTSAERLCAVIQSAVDAAREEGADYVILMSHLGVGPDYAPYESTEVIARTTGIDVVLDGHSHSVIESEPVQNARGETVLLTSTGTKLANIGCLTIGADGSFSTRLINDQGAGAFLADINARFEEQLQQVVAHTDVDLCMTDPKTGSRMIRSRETNLGDLSTDALRFVTGADVAIWNSGGLRADIPAGDITYGNILTVYPFRDQICMVEATGQEILDALELSASKLPGEFGGFLQVSGMSVTIDMGIPSSVKQDENGRFLSAEGERRVKDVRIGDEPLDPQRVYTLASHGQLLHSQGDGYSMFADNNFVLDELTLDSQAFIAFVTQLPNGTVGAEYADPYGQGRITIVSGTPDR